MNKERSEDGGAAGDGHEGHRAIRSAERCQQDRTRDVHFRCAAPVAGMGLVQAFRRRQIDAGERRNLYSPPK